MLQYSAIPLAGVDDLTQRAGAVNMVGALRVARRANPYSWQGQFWLTSSPGSGVMRWCGSATSSGVTRRWGPPTANHVVWGDSNVNPVNVVWKSLFGQTAANTIDGLAAIP